ncbi:hypothetical protein PIB30_103497 [Stylosanthes scabra]|uniref:Uncharacterized protein n=1 Tax=Stylosanthes scabra TaxID=79078 RepID=A0ABU6ZWN9_9FABA|nr:hypothetical protein [Stylosanthes scabra]
MGKLKKKMQQGLQGYSVKQYLDGAGQVRRGRTAKESPDQVTQTLAPHAYAFPPRICVVFNSHNSYAYAYHLIHHPAQPPFYTKATLPTYMRALHAYA